MYALDAKSGCIIWTFKAKSGVRAGVVIGPRAGSPGKYVAYLGDGRANAYALDAATGEQIWTRSLEDHKSANITGTPTLYEGRLFVPISSIEEGSGMNAAVRVLHVPRQPGRARRRHRIAALEDLHDQRRGQADREELERARRGGGRRAAASGRRRPSTSSDKSSTRRPATCTREPQQPTSDAIMAFDLDTGAVKWTSQVTAKDIFIVGCGGPQNGANCPPAEDLGPDFDFGNAPILVKRPDGKDVIVAGQKSGVGWAFDPDKKGAVLWQYRAGKGSALGGLEFGSAVDSTQAYFAVSDMLGGSSRAACMR